jgi:hypothetical protein
VHESVDAPEPDWLVGLTEHEVLLVTRLTRPVKPLSPVTVIVEVPAEPARTTTEVGPAVIVKSWTTNMTGAE